MRPFSAPVAWSLALMLTACQAPAPTETGFGLILADPRVAFLVGPVEATPVPATIAQAPAPGAYAPSGGATGRGDSGGSGGSAGLGSPAAPAATRAPSRGGGGSSGGGSTPRATPTPEPTPTPTPAPGGVLTNTLEAGPGAIAGLALDVVQAGVPVAGAIVTIVSQTDPALSATIRTGPAGDYALTGIALGPYLVTAEKAGHAAGGTPVEVILYTSAPEVRTVHLALAPP